MEFTELLLKRRSVRSYTKDKLSREQLMQVLQAGLLSASGRARKPWELVVVEDENTLQKLVQCRTGAANMLKEAACAIVVWADPSKTDVWTEDCSLLMGNMHLMAANLGLGSCWIQGRLRTAANGESTEEYCRRLLGVPDGYVLEAILALGVIKEPPQAHSIADADMTKVHYGKF